MVPRSGWRPRDVEERVLLDDVGSFERETGGVEGCGVDLLSRRLPSLAREGLVFPSLAS
jgi:hypothetical protein